MREMRKVSRSNKAKHGNQMTDGGRQRTEEKKAEGSGQKWYFNRAQIPSAFRHLSSVVRRQTIERLFLSLDFLKIRIHHVIVSRFR